MCCFLIKMSKMSIFLELEFDAWALRILILEYTVN